MLNRYFSKCVVCLVLCAFCFTGCAEDDYSKGTGSQNNDFPAALTEKIQMFLSALSDDETGGSYLADNGDFVITLTRF